jgi:antitoxin component YwqK of YwqJK toxin-antitoxin module
MIFNFKLINIIGLLLYSIFNFAQTEKPDYEFEISRTDIIYEHNIDTTLTKLYNKNKELLNGKYKIIHEDSIETYVTLKNGLWDGFYKSYYKTGELNAIILFENGIKKERAVWYYKNGNLNREISYLNRQQNGICKWYYENGNLLKECEYTLDKENGICKWYFEDGKIQTIVTYDKGIKNGLSEKYKSNGDLEIRIYFLNDKKVTEKEFKKAK